MVTGLLFIYALTSKTDITFLGGIICASIGTILSLWLVNRMFDSAIIHYIISIASLWITALYIVYDIQLIVGQNGKKKLSLDNYICGAMMLYIDFVRMFSGI